MSETMNDIQAERQRILTEYERREREISSDLYAPWQPAQSLLLAGRRRAAEQMLHKTNRFPRAGAACLEVGCGSLGWFADLINWGVRETDLHGIELSPSRAERARLALPQADIRIGDAAELPWDSGSFELVIASTLFSSVLSQPMREQIASEMARVVNSGGAILLYDFVCNSPGNSNVRGIRQSEIRRLFPQFQAARRSVTLAPPIARLVASISWPLATILEAIPVLRTHLLTVLFKD